MKFIVVSIKQGDYRVVRDANNTAEFDSFDAAAVVAEGVARKLGSSATIYITKVQATGSIPEPQFQLAVED